MCVCVCVYPEATPTHLRAHSKLSNTPFTLDGRGAARRVLRRDRRPPPVFFGRVWTLVPLNLPDRNLTFPRLFLNGEFAEAAGTAIAVMKDRSDQL